MSDRSTETDDVFVCGFVFSDGRGYVGFTGTHDECEAHLVTKRVGVCLAHEPPVSTQGFIMPKAKWDSI